MKLWILLNSSVDYLKLAANCFLCLSALSILIDFGPYDFLSSYKQQRAAVNTLKTRNLIIGQFSPSVDWGNTHPTIDAEAFGTLTKLIRERSPKTSQVDWDRAIGIVYSTLRFSTKEGVDASKAQPLNIVLLPASGNTIETVNVGALPDLDTWLSLDHQIWLNRTALFLLMLGFLMQFLENLWGLRQRKNNRSEKRWRPLSRRLRQRHRRTIPASQRVSF